MKKQTILILTIFIFLILAMIIYRLLFPTIQDDSIYPFYGHMIGGWMMPFGMLGMGIFWFFIITWSIKQINQSQHEKTDSAFELLKKRLAQGEITIEEFEELKAKLKGDK